MKETAEWVGDGNIKIRVTVETLTVETHSAIQRYDLRSEIIDQALLIARSIVAVIRDKQDEAMEANRRS